MNKASGFTLVEVLIALLIVSLVFFTCLLSLSEMTKNTEMLTSKTISALISNNIITQAKLGMIAPDVSSGEQVMLNQTWHWTLEKDKSSFGQVKEMTVVVKNSKGSSRFQISGFYHEKK